MPAKKSNNWYIITGGPCAGKTTALKELERRGYKVQYEMARIFIDKEIARGKNIEDIRGDEGAFQKKMLKMKVELEKKLPKGKIIFFDLGVPDSIAYYQMAGLSTKDTYLTKAVEGSSYKKIFLLEMYPYKKDYARIQPKEDALKIQRLLESSYKRLGYPIVKVPVMPTVKERVDFILNNL
ncbi:MAG: hypothetical protein COS72_02165 [Candidatus Moranbacteria bacterium CG06_land_8_20_14_3_00_43_56]|nr:MAG: hypothetical protein COS72_02165 [Candidatus Moranbacteria bacterium CG06_land_8_20_14_3_00_43_56]PJA86340.1 MAG: hypothetical protein CO142_00585 [Candidatus Moranbacteria bacterium CG_4_9_14_3_um_filter_44_28]